MIFSLAPSRALVITRPLSVMTASLMRASCPFTCRTTPALNTREQWKQRAVEVDPGHGDESGVGLRPVQNSSEVEQRLAKLQYFSLHRFSRLPYVCIIHSLSTRPKPHSPLAGALVSRSDM
jgi:hypothetical protein